VLLSFVLPFRQWKAAAAEKAKERSLPHTLHEAAISEEATTGADDESNATGQLMMQTDSQRAQDSNSQPATSSKVCAQVHKTTHSVDHPKALQNAHVAVAFLGKQLTRKGALRPEIRRRVPVTTMLTPPVVTVMNMEVGIEKVGIEMLVAMTPVRVASEVSEWMQAVSRSWFRNYGAAVMRGTARGREPLPEDGQEASRLNTN
jgi:hypothetical protein